jgi:hypothetical protein
LTRFAITISARPQATPGGLDADRRGVLPGARQRQPVLAQGVAVGQGLDGVRTRVGQGHALDQAAERRPIRTLVVPLEVRDVAIEVVG